MYINTQVVRALMALRRIEASTLANIANVPFQAFVNWLNEKTEASDDSIAFDTQLEILRVLGINGETPRNDIVHYWFLHEPLFSRSSKNFWALSVLTNAFGKAEAVYFAKETDPLAAIASTSHFGLQFPSFKAVLEVTAHPLRNVGFSPSEVEDLAWAPGNFGVLLKQSDFEKLGQGLITPQSFDNQLSLGRETIAWERLNLLARDQNIGADQLERLLLSVRHEAATPKLAALRPSNVTPSAKAEAVPGPENYAPSRESPEVQAPRAQTDRHTPSKGELLEPAPARRPHFHRQRPMGTANRRPSPPASAANGDSNGA